ncbi:MAG: methylated-DNA--[protein]-cysteine S-methyltransferase [Holophagales bacterium]|jgi:methylated-DNA-[protein]-cysteine S-methyltransferase|nr:methylated-DNA--[protein]-cysteine S-methyltransferase [Holophagales bacterium]
MKTLLETATVETAAGAFWLAARNGALVAAGFADSAPRLLARLETRFGPLEPHEASDPAGAASALGRYLAGERAALEAVPVDLGGTPFQRDVWAALRTIPEGTTITYAELASRVGRPLAVRAVGSANGANPVSVFVPCHRVVGKDGLRGYAGGVARKEWLLAHEKARPG